MVAPGSTRNRVGGDEPPRGFESHPLRHFFATEAGRARASGAGERCPSGRRGTTGNRVHVQKACRGFKSLPLRHFASRRGRARRGGSGTLYPQSALAGSNSRPEVRPCWTEPGGAALKAGPHAPGIYQPPQARKGARVRRPSRVPWDPLAGVVSVRRSQDGWYRRRVHGHFLFFGGGPCPPPTASPQDET